jgi:death-on-curing protein
VKEPRWIAEADVLAIHERLLSLYGGAAGLRDEAPLKSAVARARQHYAHDNRATIIGITSVYTSGIVRNHPFVDGNKRTGFVIGVLFLEMNGHRFTASEEDATQAVLAVAAGTLDEAGFTAWMRANFTR